MTSQYPSLAEVDRATKQQLDQWAAKLPVPQTLQEMAVVNRIMMIRKGEYKPSRTQHEET